MQLHTKTPRRTVAVKSNCPAPICYYTAGNIFLSRKDTFCHITKGYGSAFGLKTPLIVVKSSLFIASRRTTRDFRKKQRKHLAEYIMAERLLLITWFGSKREFEPDLFLINGKNCRLQEPTGGGKIFARKIPGLHAAKIGTGNVIRKRFMRFPISNRRKLFQGIRGSVWTEQNSYRCKISQKHLLQT